MILIYESMAKQYVHLPVNECMLKIIDNIFKENKVFYADSEHNKLIKKNFNKSDIKFINVKIPDLNNKIIVIFVELFNQLWIKWINRKNNISNLILTNSPAHTVFFAKILYRKCNITFIIHGSLEKCGEEKRFYKLAYYSKASLVFKNDNKRIKYIVLGNSIKRNALKIIPQIEKNLYSIPHPYKFNDVLVNEDNNIKKINRKIKIGTIGIGSKSKGTDLLFVIENKLKDLLDKDLELHHIGKVVNIDIPKNTKICFHGHDSLISTVKYNELIKELDYILFLFPVDSYKFTASGTLLDAIKLKKPIIALRNDFFHDVFDTVGDIGYLCNDVEEISNKIINIIKNNIYPQPDNFYSNVKVAIEKFDYINVEKEIRNQKIWN